MNHINHTNSNNNSNNSYVLVGVVGVKLRNHLKVEEGPQEDRLHRQAKVAHPSGQAETPQPNPTFLSFVCSLRLLVGAVLAYQIGSLETFLFGCWMER
jgi:hypothetical protein